MIVRIVRMEFRPDSIAQFETLFTRIRHHIRQQPGCELLELHGDPGNPLVRYTLSHWQQESDLEQYRHSALFAQVWPETKALFGARPQAYSLSLIDRVEIT
ncbi:MAG: antibiotic biosynthesis monooxygenase [Bacteroidota bacterium]